MGLTTFRKPLVPPSSRHSCTLMNLLLWPRRRQVRLKRLLPPTRQNGLKLQIASLQKISRSVTTCRLTDMTYELVWTVMFHNQRIFFYRLTRVSDQAMKTLSNYRSQFPSCTGTCTQIPSIIFVSIRVQESADKRRQRRFYISCSQAVQEKPSTWNSLWVKVPVKAAVTTPTALSWRREMIVRSQNLGPNQPSIQRNRMVFIGGKAAGARSWPFTLGLVQGLWMELKASSLTSPRGVRKGNILYRQWYDTYGTE